MDTELTEVRDFLAATPPFDLLPAGVLDGIPARLLVRYYRRGATILAPGDHSDALYVIRSGAVDLVDAQGALLDRRDVGAGFGMSTLLRGGEFKNYITAIEDTPPSLISPAASRIVVVGAADNGGRRSSSRTGVRRMGTPRSVACTDSTAARIPARMRER